jgi:hypothetical protein
MECRRTQVNVGIQFLERTHTSQYFIDLRSLNDTDG